MELSVEEFLEGLLGGAAHAQPSDSVKPSELMLELPAWFDERKFKLGQQFYWDNLFACMTSMLTGLLAVLAVPSILRVLVHTGRSSSPYTAYRRYLATILHVVAWHRHPLRPGSVSWRSLHAVRSRHRRAGTSALAAGLTHVSQRDLALTQFGFLGFTVTRPEQLGVRADEDAWEGLVHFWRTVGHMIGLQDRYNICRGTAQETRAVCAALRDRVFAPCLENAPEFFEHMSYVMLDGVWAVNPNIEVRSMLFFTRYMAEVPGYVYTEQERLDLRRALEAALERTPHASGVDTYELISRPAVEGLPERPARRYRPDDYRLLDTVPEYKRLSLYSKYKLALLIYVHRSLYTTSIGRSFLNWTMRLSFWLMENLPFLAFPRFGFRNAYADLFREAPKDRTRPKSNEESLREQSEVKWYSVLLPYKSECIN